MKKNNQLYNTMIKKIILFASIFIIAPSTFSQNSFQENYKKVDTVFLQMEIFLPPNIDSSKSYPALVFFFGGGWKNGGTGQFKQHAKYFSERGIACFLADYRVKTRQNTSPFESLKDAKSAIRFIRANAKKYHVDPTKIVASGGSAGGHLAAATALIKDYNEDSDDLNQSCIPNALILFNPVIDNGPGGYGYDRIGDNYKNFSPIHNILIGAPPTLFLLGTQDILIPVATAKYYKTVMEKVGSRCDLKLYEGESHGFFNYHKKSNYYKTVYEADKFLTSLGYLKGEPTIKLEN